MPRRTSWQSVGRENVRLQYDAYHMQRMEGDLTATIERHLGEIAHVQVADSPGRGQPGTGEINFDYVFRRLEELGYDGLVGLEYKPPGGDTEASLAWLPREQRAAATRGPERSTWMPETDRIHRPGRHGRPDGRATSWRRGTRSSSTAAARSPSRRSPGRAPRRRRARARSPSAPTW